MSGATCPRTSVEYLSLLIVVLSGLAIIACLRYLQPTGEEQEHQGEEEHMIARILGTLGILALVSTPLFAQDTTPTPEDLTLRPGDKIIWTADAPHRLRFGGSVTHAGTPLPLTPFADVQNLLGSRTQADCRAGRHRPWSNRQRRQGHGDRESFGERGRRVLFHVRIPASRRSDGHGPVQDRGIQWPASANGRDRGFRFCSLAARDRLGRKELDPSVMETCEPAPRA